MTGNGTAEAASFADEFTTESVDPDVRPLVPPSCDLFVMTAEQAQTLSEKGADPYVDRLNIARLVNSQRDWIRMPGTATTASFPAVNATKAWLVATFGPGSYFVCARNARHQIIGGVRHDLGGAPGHVPPGMFHPASPGANGNGGAPAGWPAPPPYPMQPAPQSAPAWPPYGGQPQWPGGQPQWPPQAPQGFYPPPAPAAGAIPTPAEAFMYKMLEKFNYAAPAPAPATTRMDEALAKLTEVVALLARGPTTPAVAVRSVADELLPTLITGLLEDRRKPAPTTPAANPQQTVQETIALLTLGAKLFNKEGKSDETDWPSLVGELADTIGVPLVVSISQAVLSPDKAKNVMEAVEAHMKARTAEAEADKAHGDVIDTEGTTVK